jgi:hypothetical protein
MLIFKYIPYTRIVQFLLHGWRLAVATKFSI